jgi:crotonobetaine/carnitine-CoA ligase
MDIQSIYKFKKGEPIQFGLLEGINGSPECDRLPLKEQVASKILSYQAKVIPNKPFVYFEHECLSYAEMDLFANKCANTLNKLQITKDSRVAILLKNRIEYLGLWFGISRLGAIQIPINTEYKLNQIKLLLVRSAIDVVVVEMSLLSEIYAAINELSITIKILIVNDKPNEKINDELLSSYKNSYDFGALFFSSNDIEPTYAKEVSGADFGVIMNTSGTTGPSKGVMLSHAQQYILGRMIAADLDLTSNDIYYNSFPLFHNTSQAMITIPVILVGASMVLVDKFSASRFWTDINKFKCTVFYYIGEIIRILLNNSSIENVKTSSLRAGWGIGAIPNDSIEFNRKYNIVMRSGYGSTEGNVPCYLPRNSINFESCGQVIPGFEVRIADEFGVELNRGEIGEILIRSSVPYALMLGYDSDPISTVQAWKNLWFHSGDSGMMDNQGNLYFKGRVKDSIRVKGENISAFEVEQTILQLNGVSEVAAIAVPSELGGDDLMVVIVRDPNTDLNAETVIELTTKYLPRFSIPRYVEFVSELPKTPTNKVQKVILRNRGITSNTWDREISKNRISF